MSPIADFPECLRLTWGSALGLFMTGAIGAAVGAAIPHWQAGFGLGFSAAGFLGGPTFLTLYPLTKRLIGYAGLALLPKAALAPGMLLWWAG